MTPIDWKENTDIRPGWLRERTSRHLGELIRLAMPAIMTRIGMYFLNMVDVAMVGNYSTDHLAWISLATQTLIMFFQVLGIGLFSAVLVFTASAFGAGNYLECGRIWRRNLPYALWTAGILMVICWPAETYFLILGQDPTVAAEASDLARIMVLGLPGFLLFFMSTMFLEGLGRPTIGFVVMVVANLVNIFLNWLLIYGNLGFPEMGATGSAWTTTAVRWVMGLGMAGYIWLAPSMRPLGIREPHGQRWSDWRDQRRLGNANAVGYSVEMAAFASLAIYAGWIGTLEIAAYGIIQQLGGIPLMASIGIGAAVSVRIGIAAGRKDRADTLLAGWTGFALCLFMMILGAGIILMLTNQLLDLFTDDIDVIVLIVPIMVLILLSMTIDALQMLMGSVLRGLKDAWWPTFVQSSLWFFVMIPLAWFLAIPYEMGVAGLIVGTLTACVMSVVVQILRFIWLMRKATPKI